ncbi:3-isopropylmalate dehydratase small subunit [Variovorax sp. LT1R16]|uniref:3-isopropylmalate dehydratase small subunit n=1 Tax=Variovorax sp. LT1R16 TaxID=3443728 RepID=UPI003F45AC19
MDKLKSVRSVVAPLDRENVDTDAIIPKQFMKSIRRTGFGPNLFDAWRYVDPGEPGKPQSQRIPNTDFVLNQPRYANARILLAGPNFGCGSSREHAPWALQQFGFRALIAPSFGEIFRTNVFKNGMLPIVLDVSIVRRLFDEIAVEPDYELAIDVSGQQIALPDGSVIGFEIEPFRKHCLLEGLDEIELTLSHADRIAKFERQRLATYPWLSNTLSTEQQR